MSDGAFIYRSLPGETGPTASESIRVPVLAGLLIILAFFGIFGQSNSMLFSRISVDPKRMNGQPCVRQLRLTVRRVVEAVATYPDRNDLQREYPELEPEDIREALAYAAANLDDKVIELAITG